MKMLLFIGPDTLALKYASKREARKALNAAAKKAKFPKGISNQGGHLSCKFKGRPYTKEELKEAQIMTPVEYWEVMAA